MRSRRRRERKKKESTCSKKESTSSTDPRSTRLHNGERVTEEEKVREYDGAKNGVAWTESLDRPERTRRRREEKGEGALAPWVPLLRKEAGNFAQPAHSGRRCASTAPEKPGCSIASHEQDVIKKKEKTQRDYGRHPLDNPKASVSVHPRGFLGPRKKSTPRNRKVNLGPREHSLRLAKCFTPPGRREHSLRLAPHEWIGVAEQSRSRAAP